MGQRLVITVQKNNEIIAGIYYHWSAYSLSALEETRRVLDCLLDEENPIKDLRLRLIRFVETNGGVIDGGFTSDEFKRIREIYPHENFKTNGSRNDGLIALTKEGIADLESWSEGDILIDLDAQIIFNSVFYTATLDDYNYDMNEEKKIEDFPEMNIELGKIFFEKLDDVIIELENLNGYEFRKGETIYELIA